MYKRNIVNKYIKRNEVLIQHQNTAVKRIMKIKLKMMMWSIHTHKAISATNKLNAAQGKVNQVLALIFEYFWIFRPKIRPTWPVFPAYSPVGNAEIMNFMRDAFFVLLNCREEGIYHLCLGRRHPSLNFNSTRRLGVIAVGSHSIFLSACSDCTFLWLSWWSILLSVLETWQITRIHDAGLNFINWMTMENGRIEELVKWHAYSLRYITTGHFEPVYTTLALMNYL